MLLRVFHKENMHTEYCGVFPTSDMPVEFKNIFKQGKEKKERFEKYAIFKILGDSKIYYYCFYCQCCLRRCSDFGAH